MAKRVVARGIGWTVARRWMRRPPWRVLWRRKPRRSDRGSWDDWVDFSPLDAADDPIGCITMVLAIIGLVLGVLLMVYVGLPMLLFLLESLWGLLVLVASVAARVLFGRPWTVEARPSLGRVETWPVRGWARSGRAIDEIAERLAAGERPPFALRLTVPRSAATPFDSPRRIRLSLAAAVAVLHAGAVAVALAMRVRTVDATDAERLRDVAQLPLGAPWSLLAESGGGVVADAWTLAAVGWLNSLIAYAALRLWKSRHRSRRGR